MNEANWDRYARVGIGIVLLGLGATVLTGTAAVVGVVTGLILTVTGAVGWCPIYATLRIGTRAKSSDEAISV